MSEQRHSREDPERTEPIRDFSGAFRDPDSAGGSGKADAAKGEDFVTSGVRLGYRLVEEQIRRGRRAARHASGQFKSSSSELQDLTERALRFYSDASRFWFDRAADLLAPFDLDDLMAEDEAAGTAPEAAPGGTAFMPLDVASSRPVRVRLNLRPGSESLPLDVIQPRARDVAKPPLMNVSFTQEAAGTGLTLRIPDDQPADVYHGVVCHRDSGEPLGTLSVEIRPS